MANRIKGITVEIGGDTTGLDKALKSVNSSITKTQSALNDVNRLLKLDPSNTVLVAQKQELLAQAISQTEEKLFLYICFLNIAEFWNDIESIRNLHNVTKPLLIKNFLEYLDESAEIENLIKRTLTLNRQVIIATLPIEKETLNKWIGDIP